MPGDPMLIQLSNLPAAVEEQSLIDLLPDPSRLVNIEIQREGNPDNVIAWIELDTSRLHAQLLAHRIAAVPRFGRRITAYVPLFGDGSA